jgi:hypothetical protein
MQEALAKLESFDEVTENLPRLKKFLDMSKGHGYSTARVKLTMTLLHHLLHLPDHYKIVKVYEDWNKKDTFNINVLGPDLPQVAEGDELPEMTITYRRLPNGSFEFDKFE